MIETDQICFQCHFSEKMAKKSMKTRQIDSDGKKKGVKNVVVFKNSLVAPLLTIGNAGAKSTWAASWQKR